MTLRETGMVVAFVLVYCSYLPAVVADKTAKIKDVSTHNIFKVNLPWISLFNESIPLSKIVESDFDLYLAIIFLYGKWLIKNMLYNWSVLLILLFSCRLFLIEETFHQKRYGPDHPVYLFSKTGSLFIQYI